MSIVYNILLFVIGIPIFILISIPLSKIFSPILYITNFLTFLIARCILFIMGWDGLGEYEYKKMLEYPKCVTVISHTSKWDFVLMLLYRCAYPIHCNHIYTVVKPQPFSFWGQHLTYIGCIPSTCAENTNNGFVDKTVNFLKNKDKYMLMIAPQGKLNNCDWKTGYYHIAKQLKCPLGVVGMDYERKKFVIGGAYDSYDKQNDIYENMDSICIKLKKGMAEIIPLYSCISHVEIRKHDRFKVSVFDYRRIITLFLPLILFRLMFV